MNFKKFILKPLNKRKGYIPLENEEEDIPLRGYDNKAFVMDKKRKAPAPPAVKKLPPQWIHLK